MRKFLMLTTSVVASSVLLFGLVGCSDVANTKAQAQGQAKVSKADQSLPFAEYFQYETFKLDNGLTVIVHEDASKSDVAVSVTFHVGSKDEPVGKTGFAHVFEHLAFNGTKRNPGEYFKYLDEIGAYSTNGTTGSDVTNYFEIVPRASLDRLLWLEADRMMNVGADASQKSLDTQIDVIVNEKRLGANQPFGGGSEMAARVLYPANHPYSHEIVGSEDDLRGASLEDVQNWYKKYYGAANAVVVMAGNISPEDGKRLAEKYFNHIPSGPGLSKVGKWDVDRKNITVQKIYDIAPVSQLSRTYSMPAVTSSEDIANAAVFWTLGKGETSFLHERLVEDLGVALSVSAGVHMRELDSVGYMTVYPADGVAMDELADHLEVALEEFMQTGPSSDDLANVYGQFRNTLVYIGDDISSKAVLMGSNYLVKNDPLFLLRYMDWTRQVSPEDVREAARKTLPFGYHEERGYALAEMVSGAPDAQIDVAPELGQAEPISVPDPQIFTLDNGLEVVLVERPASPLIAMELVLPLGSDNLTPVDQVKMNAAMDFAMEAGAGGFTKKQQVAKLTAMGVYLNAWLNFDMATYSVTTDSTVVDETLDIFVKIINETDFGSTDFEEFMAKKAKFSTVSDRHLPAKGSEILAAAFFGDENDISSAEKAVLYPEFGRSELQEMFTSWMKPSGARLYVVGDVRADETRELLNKKFGDWTGNVPKVAKVARTFPDAPSRPKFILLNDEGADQTSITGFRRLKPLPAGDNYVANIANEVFGGSFTSRLNTNLREDKGWTYGIRHSLRQTEQIDRAVVSGSVTDVHTVDAVKEIMKELRDIRTTRPVTSTELSEVVTKKVGSFNTDSNDGTLRVLKMSDIYGQDYNYYEGLADRYGRVTASDVNESAKELFNENEYVWVLVGDLDSFERELRAANLGDIEVYNSAGEFVR